MQNFNHFVESAKINRRTQYLYPTRLKDLSVHFSKDLSTRCFSYS